MADKTTVLRPAPARAAREYHKGLIIEPGLALNEVAAVIYRLLDGQRTLDQVADAVAVQYDVDSAECLHDVLSLGEELLEEGVVQAC